MAGAEIPSPGELRERYESRRLKVSRRGMVGERTFLTLWSEKFLLVPSLGSQWPDVTVPGWFNLRLVDYDFSPYGQSGVGVPNEEYAYCAIVCQYATLTGPEDAPSSSWDGALEIMDVGEGRLWASDSAACDQPLNKKIPLSVSSMEYSVPTEIIPPDVILLEGCVNADVFFEQLPGHVMYETFRSRNEWDPELGLWRSRIECRFIINPRHSWQEAWRPDIAAWDTTIPLLYDEVDLYRVLP